MASTEPQGYLRTGQNLRPGGGRGRQSHEQLDSSTLQSEDPALWPTEAQSCEAGVGTLVATCWGATLQLEVQKN